MLNKKLMIISIFFVSLLAVSAVSAADNATDDVVSVEETDITNIEMTDEIDLENDDLTAVDENEALSANPKTFADLNTAINGNNDSDVYLDDNYKFELGSDDAFKDGVVIGRAVTVHGNGFTLDGDNVARIFSVTNSDVVFRDIVFVNGKTTGDGGAIDGKSTAINCIFNFNSANHGGGMSGEGCSAVNCTFNGNYADDYGSAISAHYGSAVNCTFNNNKAVNNGGAMFGSYTYALNCTFNGNSVIYSGGGAMCGGEYSAVNCTFNSNSAGYGGAMAYGSAVNCTFSNNHAYDGGALYYGSAVNCSFSNNRADRYAGAIYYDSAVNCTFTNNRAGNDGGAIYYGSAVNCTFTNNKAGNDGGAMIGEGYTATNCQFTNNTAKNGGSTYKITANNCNFTENTATEYGGAMYEGTARNCVFKDNKAGISGDNTYNSNIPKSILIVYNFTSTYSSGDKLLFNLTTASRIPISNANITIRVYKNNALVGTYYALSGEGWTVELDVGSYIAVCSVENQAYEVEPANATMAISKADTKLTSSAVSAVYNSNKNLVVTLKDSQGKPISNVEVSINVGGVKKLTTDKNGQAKLNIANLVPKTYTAKITFNGNDNYKASSASVKVTVKKAKPAITAKAKTFKKAKKVKKYSITLKSGKTPIKNAKVAIKINKKTYPAKTNKKGVATFKIKNLKKKGTFKATVKYAGNAYYNSVTKTVKIKIK